MEVQKPHFGRRWKTRINEAVAEGGTAQEHARSFSTCRKYLRDAELLAPNAVSIGSGSVGVRAAAARFSFGRYRLFERELTVGGDDVRNRRCRLLDTSSKHGAGHLRRAHLDQEGLDLLFQESAVLRQLTGPQSLSPPISSNFQFVRELNKARDV
jgi:hypothetical protein